MALGSSRVGAALALLLGLGVAVSSPHWLPYNMDEFAHYHALGCYAFPLSRAANLYRESCSSQELRLPGSQLFLPLRSYAYIGSLPVVPFFPFWFLTRDPLSVRLQGVVFFLLATWLISRLSEARPGSALLGGLLYPIFPFLFLSDTGPNGLTILLDLLALLACEKALRSQSLGPAALAGGLVFLGIFTKPVFALYLPALALFAAHQALPEQRSVKKALAFGTALIVPSALLFFSVDRSGHAYYSVIRRGGISYEPASIIEVARLMGSYLLSASRVVPRTLLLKASPIDWLPGITALAVCRAVFRDARVRVFFFMAALTFLLTLAVGAASEPHHLAFTLTPLVIGITRALHLAKPSVKRLAALSIFLFLGTLAFRWPTAEVSPDTGFEKDRLLASLRRSGLESSSMQVHASWGTYYIAHLFGEPDQAVVYLDVFGASSDALRAVREFASAHKRTIVLVCGEGKGEAARRLESDFGPILRSQRFGEWSFVLFSGI